MKHVMAHALCRLVLVCGLLPVTASAQAPAVAEDITGTIVDVSGTGPLRSTEWLRLHIEGTTTPEEVMQYYAILREKGPDAVVSAMQRAEEKEKK